MAISRSGDGKNGVHRLSIEAEAEEHGLSLLGVGLEGGIPGMASRVALVAVGVVQAVELVFDIAEGLPMRGILGVCVAMEQKTPLSGIV